MILERPYSKDTFDEFLRDFLPDFNRDERPVRTPDKSILTEVTQLGTSNEANLTVLEAKCEETDSKKRIAITQAAFKALRDHSIRNALIAFHDGADQWRLSLLTSTLELNDGKVIKKDSNPRRYSYLLGLGAKTRTPHKYLIEKGKVSDIKSLQERFSVEVVNKQFYESIADLFTKLVGGERGRTRYPGLLKINGQTHQNSEHQEFAVRLIGRIIFSWFLKEKKSAAGIPIVPDELLSLSAIASHGDYYHAILEPLFFELLNKRVKNRHEALRQVPFATVPYLNGGLFSPQYDDYYQQNSFTGGGNPGIVSIPDSWFTELFTVLEQYNFTVDENTSYDVELSIDPEMLGRIFENLLAEINPETGESARKSTGSFYTPREIVDYMADSSLLEYLKLKTGIDDGKLRAIISWGQDDDADYPLSNDEKKRIVDALATLTILDPACGSGAFPIGLLQKVVYILQQVDKKAEIWLENQLNYVASPELRRDIEEKYKSENYDWLRKLGVIRESIFGVDIQTIATEIAKLRCFLTLIIEEDVDDEKENRGIRALPNLDFKFVTSNSLVKLPEGSNKKQQPAGAINMFEDSSHISRLKEIRNKYFGADADERARLQIEFKDLQLSMFKSRVASSGATSDLYNILSDWNPFSHDKTEWFDAEWMFGIENGFDIIIGNPPYVSYYSRQAKPLSSDVRQYYSDNYTFLAGSKKKSINTTMLFLERGLSLAADQGILTLIIDIGFFEKVYKEIRSFLADFDIKELVYNISDFENVASGQIIIRIQNQKVIDIKCVVKNYFQYEKTIDKSHFLGSTLDIKERKTLDEELYLSLEELCTVSSGLEYSSLKYLFLSPVKLNDNYHKVINGKELKNKYCHEWTADNGYVLFDKEFEKELVNENKNVSPTGKTVYFVSGKKEKYLEPKIFIRQSAMSIVASLDFENLFCLRSLFVCNTKYIEGYSLKFILGILNSLYIENYAIENGIIRYGAGKQPQIRVEGLKRIPIPIRSSQNEIIFVKIEQLVTSIIGNENTIKHIEETKRQIDQLVYKLYALSPKEIQQIEETTK